MITRIVQHVIDVAKGKHPHGTPRSGEWPKTRAEHLRNNPVCANCGSKEHLEVHHIKPFHLHPEDENNPNNLITLCESKKNGVNCHLYAGHLGNYRSFNVNVLTDAMVWAHKLATRPKGDSA